MSSLFDHTISFKPFTICCKNLPLLFTAKVVCHIVVDVDLLYKHSSSHFFLSSRREFYVVKLLMHEYYCQNISDKEVREKEGK